MPRLLKEISAYEKEVDLAQSKLDDMKSEGKDEFELKQQVRSLSSQLPTSSGVQSH